MTTQTSLTPASIKLFTDLWNDAGNWGGAPLVDVTPAERGNLTHLKQAGLLHTELDGNDAFAYFSRAGVALAAELGLLENDLYYTLR